MAKNTRFYGYNTVAEYIRNCDTVADMEVIEGGLLDTYILYHGCGVIEIFEEVYLNEWSSAYARHIYRKGLPKRWTRAIDDERKRRDYEDALATERAISYSIEHGTF